MIAESTKAQVRSRRPAGMETASGYRERTHKDKAFIFSQIGHFHHQRTHSDHRLCYQLLAAILGPISPNFEWIVPPDRRIANCQGLEAAKRSRFSVPRSAFAVPGSLFPVYYSLSKDKSLVVSNLCFGSKEKPRQRTALTSTGYKGFEAKFGTRSQTKPR